MKNRYELIKIKKKIFEKHKKINNYFKKNSNILKCFIIFISLCFLVFLVVELFSKKSTALFNTIKKLCLKI